MYLDTLPIHDKSRSTVGKKRVNQSGKHGDFCWIDVIPGTLGKSQSAMARLYFKEMWFGDVLSKLFIALYVLPLFYDLRNYLFHLAQILKKIDMIFVLETLVTLALCFVSSNENSIELNARRSIVQVIGGWQLYAKLHCLRNSMISKRNFQGSSGFWFKQSYLSLAH